MRKGSNTCRFLLSCRLKQASRSYHARLVERTTNALVTKDDGALEEVKKALIQAWSCCLRIGLCFLVKCLGFPFWHNMRLDVPILHVHHAVLKEAISSLLNSRDLTLTCDHPKQFAFVGLHRPAGTGAPTIRPSPRGGRDKASAAEPPQGGDPHSRSAAL